MYGKKFNFIFSIVKEQENINYQIWYEKADEFSSLLIFKYFFI